MLASKATPERFACLFLVCRLNAAGISCKSSVGSTPSCSHPVDDMAKLSEVHPGNYVFYGALLLKQHLWVVNLMHWQGFFDVMLGFRRAAGGDRLLQPGGCGCESFNQSHRTLSTQEPAPDRLWVECTQVLFQVVCVLEPLTELFAVVLNM